ncbi:MAG: polyisoprenoid-binding protein [Acidimicrobiales bacterium]|nr:MAG: polyisoprenoid-binding protein [Acidimicrobiales bacterium]
MTFSRINRVLSATTLGAFLLLSACSQAPEATAQAEKVTEKTAAATTYEPIGIPSGTYVMDKEHGYVTFSYSHFGLSNPQLRFRDIDASVQLDAENLENSKVTALIKSASIDSGVDRFDDHLNSDGWFDTAKFPEITFESTGFTRESQTTGKMTGDLTIMGTTKPITFDVTLLKAFDHPMKKSPYMGLEGKGTLLRSDFGLGKYAPNVTDEVSILISGEFGKSE